MRSLFFITVMLVTGVMTSRAQRQDTLAALKLFMKVCNDYKRLPMQVDLDIQNSANILVSPGDTSHLQARLFARREGSYISFGDMEQIANDSLLLLVSGSLKKMLLYSNHRSVADQLQLSLSLQLQDPSLKKLAGRYEARIMAIAKDTAEMILYSRMAVPHTSLPMEAIHVRYDPTSLQPYEIVHISRSLRRVPEAEYGLLEKRLVSGMVVHPDSAYYAVRERSSDCRYDRIAHIPNVALPARVDDRIKKDGPGEYKPAARFESYSVTREY